MLPSTLLLLMPRIFSTMYWPRYTLLCQVLTFALESFQALGIEFVSLTEGVDTSTPAGKMVFTVLGAVAELERSLIAERVKAGLRNARAKGKKLGRPKVVLDPARIAALRKSGLGWQKISRELGVGVGTVLRIAHEGPEGHSKNHTSNTFRTPERKTRAKCHFEAQDFGCFNDIAREFVTQRS